MTLKAAIKLSESPNEDDAKLVMEYIKEEFYPDMPNRLKLFFWFCIREDILLHYVKYRTNGSKDDFVNTVKWK